MSLCISVQVLYINNSSYLIMSLCISVQVLYINNSSYSYNVSVYQEVNYTDRMLTDIIETNGFN